MRGRRVGLLAAGRVQELLEEFTISCFNFVLTFTSGLQEDMRQLIIINSFQQPRTCPASLLLRQPYMFLVHTVVWLWLLQMRRWGGEFAQLPTMIL